MAITKQFLKTRPVCKVTFTVPAKEATSVAVVGDFNNWATDGAELKKLKNGNFKGTFDVESGKAYEFRYIIDGDYANDEAADRYQWNEFAGTENSIVEA